MKLSRGAAPRILAGVLFAMAFLPSIASAQSLFGCRNLLSAQVPAYEGTQGVFFRVDPDLMNSNRLSSSVVVWMGELTRALAERGTSLIVVPVPTKSLAMPQYLGQGAAAFGYDPIVAATIYTDTLARLAEAGVVAVDARQALLTSVSGERTFFKADPRLTSAGTQALARAVTELLGDADPSGLPFETSLVGTATLPSPDRIFLQMNCSAPVPEVSSKVFTTTRDVRNEDDGPAPVVVVSTETTAAPALNFAGFLAELSGQPVDQHGMSEDPVAALSGYLLSDDFRQNQPRHLIWEFPIWANPALHGDQPLREALAAARDDCPLDLATEVTADGTIKVDLSEAEQGPDFSLMLENSKLDAPRADFRFAGQDGLVRPRSIQRSVGEPLTGRFFMPLTGLWPEGSAMVEITVSFDPETPPRVALCRG